MTHRQVFVILLPYPVSCLHPEHRMHTHTAHTERTHNYTHIYIHEGEEGKISKESFTLLLAILLLLKKNIKHSHFFLKLFNVVLFHESYFHKKNPM